MKTKKIISLMVIGVAVLSLGMLTVSALTNAETKAGILAELTGKSEAEITALKTEDKTYGQVAAENGVLEEFKEANLEATKAMVQAKVAAGEMTQEEATARITNMEQNQENCDGSGTGTRQRLGLHNGSGSGKGQHRYNQVQ